MRVNFKCWKPFFSILSGICMCFVFRRAILGGLPIQHRSLHICRNNVPTYKHIYLIPTRIHVYQYIIPKSHINHSMQVVLTRDCRRKVQKKKVGPWKKEKIIGRVNTLIIWGCKFQMLIMQNSPAFYNFE